MHLNRTNFRKSETCASDILSRYNIEKAPIPVEQIIKWEGLQLVEYNLGEDISGILMINETFSAIGVNPKNHPNRQRFSMAHELGHYLLHKDRSNLFIDKDFIVMFRHSTHHYSVDEKRQEQEANAFAAALLMPTRIIENEVDRLKIYSHNETELISELAKNFKVSEVAMSYRFSTLNNFF